MNKCREYVAAINAREAERQKEVALMQSKLDELQQYISRMEGEQIHLFTQNCLMKVQTRIESQELGIISARLLQAEQLYQTKRKEVNSLRAENKQLLQRVADAKVQAQLTNKKLQKQVKELKSMLKREKKLREKLEMGGVDSSSNRLSVEIPPSPSKSFSSSSRKSESDFSTSQTGDTTSINEDKEVLQKENNILLQRVAELQTWKWRLEEKVRLLTEQNYRIGDELEKKAKIIQHFTLQNVKLGLGRSTPEFDIAKSELARKGEKKGSFMGSLFGKQKSVPQSKVSVDAFNKMQQVMEEALLHNIQLQNDIRTLGNEIARLLHVQKQMQKKLAEHNIEFTAEEATPVQKPPKLQPVIKPSSQASTQKPLDGSRKT